LHALLQALIRIYLAIIDTLLKPPPSTAAVQANKPNDLLRHAENTRLVAVNMHHLLNELRPVQARETLLALKRSRLDAKKLRTTQLKESGLVELGGPQLIH
jgi:mediator of RNA polymerase II transcription subunit 7